MADGPPPDPGGWRRRRSRFLFESHWFRLRQDEITLPGGDDITYTLVDHPGWVMVVPILEDGRVVMERIYRYTVQETLLECPSGGIDPGEAPEVAGARELEEETGYRAARLHHLGHFVGSPGISNERFDLYLATDLTADGTIERENTEQMEVELHAFAPLCQRAARGELGNGPTTLALLLAEAWLRGRLG